MTATLIGITLRGLVNRRRTLWLGLLGVLIVVVAALYLVSEPTAAESTTFTAHLLADFGLAVLLPLVAVIVGTAALGSEIEDGTIVYLLARPVPRWKIVLAKLLVAWLIVSILVAVPILLAGAVGGSPRLGAAYGIAAIVGALEYTAIFVALSVLTSRALIVGLAYVIVWEGIVGALFAGTRVFSVRQHILSVAEQLGGSDALPAQLEIGVALATVAVVIALATALAVRRLETVELRGETA